MPIERNHWARIGLLAGLTLALAGAGGTFAAELKITGPAGRVVILSQADLAAIPHYDLQVELEGKAIAFSGVPLTALLERVGAPTGKALRGRALCDIVVVSASDGYAVTLALAETDPMFRKDRVLIADRADGAVLPDEFGPFRLVVEGDLRGARFARMVTEISVVELSPCGRRK